MDSVLNASIGRKVITLLDLHENIIKFYKLTGITEMLLNLDKLNNIDNLENGRLSNVLLRYQMTGSEEFMHLEPVASQYRRLRNKGFAFITLAITEQRTMA